MGTEPKLRFLCTGIKLHIYKKTKLAEGTQLLFHSSVNVPVKTWWFNCFLCCAFSSFTYKNTKQEPKLPPYTTSVFVFAQHLSSFSCSSEGFKEQMRVLFLIFIELFLKEWRKKMMIWFDSNASKWALNVSTNQKLACYQVTLKPIPIFPWFAISLSDAPTTVFGKYIYSWFSSCSMTTELDCGTSLPR